MAILACGVNYKTASIDIRERMVVDDSGHDRWIDQFLKESSVEEAAILSTCNRTELYCETKMPGQVVDWLHRRYHLPTDTDHLYTYRDRDAVRHMMRVACGLDSMILGESQILGQIKLSYRRAEKLGSIGPQLAALFQHVFAVSKRVRTQTAIGMRPVSVAYAASLLARRVFSDLSQLCVLVIGTGKTAMLAARHLQQHGTKRFIIASRNQQNADDFSREFAAEATLLSDLPDYLPWADLVLSATASSLPLLTKSMVEIALKLRRYRSMLMIDLGVPRDMERSISELGHSFLYNIDDLNGIVEDGLSERQEAALNAECIVELELENYIRCKDALQSASFIKSYRDKMALEADAVLEQALKSLKASHDPELVLRSFSRRLLNKLTHQPSVRLRQAGYEGREDLLHLSKYLFSD